MHTSVHEIADGVYRLSTCVPDVVPGGFTFNQYLIDAEEPLLFHTGPRRMFPLVADAVGRVLDVSRLRWISFGHVVRTIATPHVPHGWEAQVLHDETTGTLLCGDLFTRTGDGPALVHDADLIGPALEAEDLFGATALTAHTAPTLRTLADLAPRTLALMHGPAYAGDGAAALHGLADAYAARLDREVAGRQVTS